VPKRLHRLILCRFDVPLPVAREIDEPSTLHRKMRHALRLLATDILATIFAPRNFLCDEKESWVPALRRPRIKSGVGRDDNSGLSLR
jgi:hypothetical protein